MKGLIKSKTTKAKEYTITGKLFLLIYFETLRKEFK